MGSFIENVNKVASLITTNVEDLDLIVQNIDAINAVAPLLNDLNDIVDNIIPNLAEILEADNNAALATAQAGLAVIAKNSSEDAKDIATTQAGLATTNGATQVALATIQASNASASAVVASAYANINWAGFNVTDGELIVAYANGLTSTPSLVDGDFIITY